MGVRVDVGLSARTAAIRIGLAIAAAAPAVAIRVAGIHLPPVTAVVVFGAAVLASVAFLLWASEAVRVDLPGTLALALLALVAVLPEYAVDIYFAFTAGSNPQFAAYAAANMTGANRLLVGVAWPLLVFFAIWAVRRRGRIGDRNWVRLEPHRRIEIVFLALATVYALVIPVIGQLAWYDTVVLGGLFVIYLWRVSRVTAVEEELVGVAAIAGRQPRGRRRLIVAVFFVLAAVAILASAEPFGDSLVASGTTLGIDEFLLVQWLAPIASEAPEVIVAVTFALRGRADDGLGALLAAKLNQWTLLIACLPVAYHLGGGDLPGLPLTPRQQEELVLTTAQTLLGVAILADLRIARSEAALLFGLFAAQFALPDRQARYLIAVVYTVLAIALIARRRHQLPALVGALNPASYDHATSRK